MLIEVHQVISGMANESMTKLQDWMVFPWNSFRLFRFVRAFRKALTFNAHIPNVAKASDGWDFCPISLVNGMYKTISKVLANCHGEDYF